MEFRVLRYFLMVAREENITRAAALLHITQPTLSRQLMQLEEELGVRLFHRSKHSIVLTEEGMLLKRRAQEMVSLSDKTVRELSHNREILSGEIAIGCGETKSMEFLSERIRDFQREHPLVQFHIHSAIADDIKERIEKGLLDMGLLTEPVNVGKYEFIRMPQREKWGVLTRRDSALALKKEIRPEDLLHIPLLMVRRELVRNELASWFGDCYEKLNVVFTSNLNTNGAIMVYNGLAYSIVIEGAISLWDQTKMTYRPLTPTLQSTSVLAWKRGQPFSSAATKFIRYAKYLLGMGETEKVSI